MNFKIKILNNLFNFKKDKNIAKTFHDKENKIWYFIYIEFCNNGASKFTFLNENQLTENIKKYIIRS